MIPQLQYAFLQDAKHFEKIINDMIKETYNWAEYQIRKVLEIGKNAPMPDGWKRKIPIYLQGFTRSIFFNKVDRIKQLRLILNNFYRINIEFEKIAITENSANKMYLEIIQDSQEQYHFLANMYLKTFPNSTNV